LPETEVNAASVQTGPKSTPKASGTAEMKGSETGVSKPLDKASQIEQIIRNKTDKCRSCQGNESL